MAITYVATLGSGFFTGTTTDPPHTLTYPSAVPVGDLIVILQGWEGDSNNGLSTSGVLIDSKGNHFSRLEQIGGAFFPGSPVGMAVWAGVVTSAISGGDTLPIYPAAALHAAGNGFEVLQFSGVTATKDGQNTGFQEPYLSSTPQNGHFVSADVTGVDLIGPHLIVGGLGAYNLNNAGETLTAGAGWTGSSISIGTAGFGGSPYSSQFLPVYQIVDGGLYPGTAYDFTAAISPEAWGWEGFWVSLVPIASSTGAKPANLHFRSGEYFSAHATTSGLQVQRANFGTPPFTFAGYATNRADDDSPNLYEGRPAELCCVFSRADPGAVHGDAGVYWISSLDDGESWTAASLLMTGTDPCAAKDGAAVELAGAVQGDNTVQFVRRYPGESSFSAPFTAQVWNGSVLSDLLLETGKGTCLSAEPGPVGRWLLVATPHSSSSLAHYQSTDEGESWVVVS